MPHVHTNAISLGVIVATVVLVNVLGRTVAAHHAKQSLAQAVNYVL